jgi:5-methylthioadenosine/S-adenosylhomocysteine deaminase
VSSREGFDMATLGGARALRMEGRIGRIEAGYLADIALLDLNTPALCPMNDAFHSLAYTVPSGAVRHVMVNGSFAVRDGLVTGVDEKVIFAECREAALRHNFAGALPKEVEAAVKDMLRKRNELCATTHFENRV